MQAKAEYNTSPITSTAPYNTYNGTEMSAAMLEYPGSPAPSITSTVSAMSYQAGASGLDLNELYSPGIGKFMCPMQGCLYGVLGFPTTEELEQHITILGHYPEPTASLDPRVTILNFENSLEETDSWLATQQELDNLSYGSYSNTQLGSTSPVTTSAPYQFTFTYEQPMVAKKATNAPSTPTSPTSSQCDCQHCHLQNTTPYPTSTGKSGSKRKRSIYDYATPLTVQLAPPITIIGLPTAPPPPPAPAARPAKKTTSPNPNDYAVWQQKIQIAQATEMIQAQHKQRDAQRRKLEIQIPAQPAPQQTYNYTNNQSELDYSSMYGYPRPKSYNSYYPINHPVC